ncbi:hypothetical protein HY230_12720 [Candidatus Acetothermia bacterium]|nr:hypothetical protein [Candidatus Acetothermia bacterium]
MAPQAAQNVTLDLATDRFIGRLTLAPEHGPVGTQVTIEGQGFPANTRLDLIWETYDARWKIEQFDGQDWNQFNGLDFKDRVEPIAQIKTDDRGNFSAKFQIPEDYGGMHDVYLLDRDRKLNKAGFRVDASAEISPKAGPLGTPIAITMKGINPSHPIEGWYQLYYDNQMVGFITAVTTRGTARVEIPAAGESGTHLIAIENACFGAPYLQLHASSYSYIKTFHFPFELIRGEPVLPPPVQEQILPEQPATAPSKKQTGLQMWTDFSEIPARTVFTLSGRGFESNSELQIYWVDIEGDRVSEVKSGRFGTGFQERLYRLANVRTDAEGNFELRLVPESVQGGAHAIEAWSEETFIARTYLRIARRAYPLKPKAGPLGTTINVKVEGVSWTEHENLIALTYDNSYLGYACGNDCMGEVVAQIYATGKPGWHFVDVYPAFRTRKFSEGIEAESLEAPFLYEKAIITWQDHPHGFRFRYAFKVE